VCFWEKDDDIFYNHEDKPDAPYEKWVNRLQPICEFGQKVMDKIHPKIDYVKIDRWDTWSMDHTLGQIALPMLKQLNATKHGAPFVDDEDVPEGLGLRSTEAPAKENEWDTDENHFKRWDWVMNEMIFAFEHHINKDWEEAYRSGEIDWKSEACEWDENGKAKMYKMVDGPKNTYKCDYDGMRIVEDRIKNGFKLFGKYYQALWD
jgi:hypothetical protein